MRTSALLLLSLILVGSAFAGDESATNSSQEPAAQSPAAGSFSTMRYDEMGRLRFLPESEAMCLKLRTYVVRRIDPNSDITRLHSYRTCTPAWKFQTRSAVLQETPSPKMKRSD
jgi:hypothetical protein